uniref:cysteine-rich secretory protein 1 n=1 Tax=Jaculus jaculus TaxID=51337 RepID=UPI001E1B1B89|nr:cysteine-rich secretory protein 1 [Jaculus jaculus]
MPGAPSSVRESETGEIAKAHQSAKLTENGSSAQREIQSPGKKQKKPGNSCLLTLMLVTSSFTGETMKFFLFLSVAAVFVPALAIRSKATRALFNKLSTELVAAQEEIVKVHNAFRRKVQPPARNMMKLNWSLPAAENARILARYCDFAQSDPIERRLKNTFCGENMHLESYPSPWSYVIELWFNESKHFTYGKWPSTDDDITTDDYTQMVWASTYLIGCDVASCRKKKAEQYLYICHYCHEGNDPDTINLPYKAGPSCGDCPNHCEDRLCTNPCVHYDEYNNCDKQMKVLGCEHPSVKLLCKASCLCTN